MEFDITKFDTYKENNRLEVKKAKEIGRASCRERV